MRKLLLSSVVLSIFAISLTVFQMSCKKEVTAQQTGSNYTLPVSTTSSLGGVIIGDGLNVTSNGTLSVNSASGINQLGKILFTKDAGTGSSYTEEVWIADYNGANQKKVNYTIPSGVTTPIETDAKLSPDGQTVFICFNGKDIYSCNTDGTNMQKIVTGNVVIEGAY